ncbi:MAG TPA: RedB protein [Phycisphaerae bacterium]|jgi:hypothetical protein|nr:RedB protein [Phycisphaerae bacterium]
MKSSGRLLAILVPLWSIAIAAGFWGLLKYAATPGRAAAATSQWPAAADQHGVHRGAGITLLMIVHPQCPCSSSSMSNLQQLLASHPATACYVLFETSSILTPELCRNSSLWKTAAHTPHITPLVDVAHLGTREFAAKTSGQVLAYDAAGALRFRGGITASRDHDGPCEGQSALQSLLDGGDANPCETPVYGCALPMEDQP